MRTSAGATKELLGVPIYTRAMYTWDIRVDYSPTNQLESILSQFFLFNYFPFVEAQESLPTIFRHWKENDKNLIARLLIFLNPL